MPSTSSHEPSAAANALAALLQKLRGASVEVVELPPAEDGRWQPDVLVTLKSPSVLKTLACKFERQLYPKQAEVSAALFAQWMRKSAQPDVHPVMLAPYISQQSAQILENDQVSHLDLSGNYLVSFDAVHLERQVPGNPFREKRELRSIFTPQAAKVVWSLLSQNGPWKGKDLASFAKVSPGHVSSIKKFLDDQTWVQSTRTDIRLIQPGALLDAWRDSCDKPRTLGLYTTLHGAALTEALKHLFAEAAGNHVLLGGASAAQHLAPYVRPTSLELTADEEGLVLITEHLKATPVDKGANVYVEQVSASAFQLASAHSVANGLYVTDPVSTYLRLWKGGERHQEAATHLREVLLQPAWAHLNESELANHV